MNANVNANDEKSTENISVCKLNFPRYIQENLKREEQKQDDLTLYFKELLKGVLENTKRAFVKDVRMISFKIRNSKRLIMGETDVNYGELHIYVWKDKQSQKIKSYCIIRSKLSGAWQKVTGIRDLRFPFKFAEAFLKEKEMNNIKLNYLKGRSTSSSILRNSVHFDPDEIMEDCGVVKEFTSPLKNNILKKFVTENYVRIQIGQIKLQIHKDRKLHFKPKDYLSMIKIIDEELCSQAKPWEVLNYVRIVEDFSLSKELKEIISRQLSDFIKRPDKQYSFEAETTLQHPYESFYQSEKELIFKRKVIKKWDREYPVTIKTVLNAVKAELKEGDNCLEEIKKLNIKFYDPIARERKAEAFVNLVQCTQILHTETEKNTYFQHNKCWYSVEQETFLRTNVRFVNIVKDCLLHDETNLPKILRWSCHFETNPKPPTFTEKEIYDFIKVNADESQSEENCKKLINILNKEYSLFTSIGENDFASSNHNVDFNVQHSEKLFDLNFSILEKSPLGKYCSKSSNESKSLSLQKFSKLLAQASDMNAIMSKLGQELDNEKLEKVKEDLLRKESCIIRAEETATCYKVNSPYVTKSLLREINLKKLNVCPVMLLQFLRMCFFQLQEGEYNELYHLSNCKCQVKNSWKYVVGDRILSSENKNIELFDVMALNMENHEVYLIHVKKGFGAIASRELSSQVYICGDQIWKSLSINSKTNMLKKFFNVATVTSDDSIHRALTKQEVEGIGKTEIQFLNEMKSTEMKYFICFSPCTSKARTFSSLFQANLDFEFDKSDFKEIDMIEKLQKAGILNERKITADIFKSKQTLQNENIFLTNSVYKKLINSIGGADTRDFLSDSSSFVAKMTLIDLYQKFSTFIFNGKQQLKLKILEIPSFEKKIKQKHITAYYPKSKKVQTEINLKSKPSIKNE